MKIGILTFPNSVSFGAVMQMYALYRKVSEMGFDVEVINYYNAYMKAEKHIGKDRKKTIVFAIKRLLSKILHFNVYSSFRKFEKKYINLYPSDAFTDKDSLQKISDRYDAVICGSDQVWNPEITNFDLSYFLDFCSDKTKRISYAPSFGKEELPGDFFEKISNEIKKFAALSIRESAGAELIEEMGDIEPVIVADPTFLISGYEWRNLSKKRNICNREYVLYYTVSNSVYLWQQCLRFAERNNLEVVAIGGNILKKIRNKNSRVKYAIDVSPQEYLYLIDNARYVFTNSFHGTAFSINLRKDFFVEYPVWYNSRLIQIISDLDLHDRVVEKDKELTTESICYADVEAKLTKIIDDSEKFLREALS